MVIEIKDGNDTTRSHWKELVSNLPILCVDFHHTITRNCEACDDFSGEYELQENAKEVLTLLSKMFTVVIYTGDPSDIPYLPPDYKSKIERFLNENEIPYRKIFFTKPPAAFIIDDRAISHKSWKSTFEEIYERVRR